MIVVFEEFEHVGHDSLFDERLMQAVEDCVVNFEHVARFLA